MRLEQQRGISVTSSVMQFPFAVASSTCSTHPATRTFSEDTYRTLTAVDSALMVIDCAKGVEERTIKLMEVCRLRDTPIMTFINKLDREGREPIELLDEIEQVLEIACAPSPGPSAWVAISAASTTCSRTASMSTSRRRRARGHARSHRAAGERRGRAFLGDRAARSATRSSSCAAPRTISPREYSRAADAGVLRLGDQQLRRDGAALGVRRVRAITAAARDTRPQRRAVESELTGFVFKIQANMDPGHRDRIAFMRICSGNTRGHALYHVRLGKEMRVADALTFLAADRQHTDEAWAGDIIGLHNHGTINIGDTFTRRDS
jgi:peptide chain release factor 3